MMKRMLLLALGLMLISAAPAFAQKVKNKTKEKRFETVVKQNVSDYAGRYTGQDVEHYIEVRVDGGGQISATSFEGPRRAELQNIRLDEGRMTATRVYPDGTTEAFTATFANRILNGTSSFGLLVEGPLSVTGSVMLNRLFYRRD